MKLTKLTFGLLAFSFLLGPQIARSQEKVEATGSAGLIAQGEGLAKGGRWQHAQEYFLKACSDDPSNIVALHDLAVSYAHTSKLDEAAECERKALAIDDKYVPAHIELAWVLNMQNNKDDARDHLKKALQIEPDNKTALQNLQSLMGRLKRKVPAPQAQTDLAVEQVDAPQVVSETPVSKALLVRGASMFRQGKYDIAKRFYEQALENCPDSFNARTSLGVVRGASGDIVGQIKEERAALLLKPKDTTVLCNLGWALAQKGELQEALSTYQKALAANPGSLEAQVGQGVLLNRTGKPEAALAVLKEAIKIHLEQAMLHQALAAVLQSVERDGEALTQYQEALRLAPGNLEIKARIADAYLATENFEKAADIYKQLVDRSPANAELRIGYGLALTKNNDIGGAYQQFKKAAELDKNLAAAHACLSMIEELKGRISQAESEARLAQQKDPQSKFFQESVERLAKSKKESDM